MIRPGEMVATQTVPPTHRLFIAYPFVICRLTSYPGSTGKMR